MMQQHCFTDAPAGNPPEHFKFRARKGTLKIQVSLARLGAGFGSAPADIIPNRIPAVFASLRSAQSERPLDVLRPRGAISQWGIYTRH